MNALDHRGRAIMRELFDEIWREGYIVDSMEEIAAITRWPIADVADVWPNMRKLFMPVDGVDSGHMLTHRRVEIERTEADRQRVARQRAGQKGGLAKAGKKADSEQLDLAPLSNAKQSRKEGSDRREEVVALGASIASGPIAPARCPFCEGREIGHPPADDCKPRRLNAAEVRA